MRRHALCLVALAFFLVRCGGGGSTPASDADAAVADAGPDSGPEDTGTPPDVAPDRVAPPDELQPPPDAGEVSNPPDVPDVQGADVPDADVPVGPECTVDEECEAPLCYVGRCVDGGCSVEPKSCHEEPDDVCTIDVCNPASGECDHQPNLDCGCTTDSECPDDANPCTDPFCQIAAGQVFGVCTFRASTLGCDDGNPCTSGELCTAVGAPRFAVCAGGSAVSCDDLDPATFDWCDPLGTPSCRNEAAVPCPNGQGDCPPPSGCYAFECDGDPESPVCAPTARTGSCDDGDYCTVQETCTDGVCGGGTPRDCDDGRPETIDSCDPIARECSHIVEPGNTLCVTPQDCIDVFGPSADTCRQWLCPLGFCADVQVPDGTSCEDGLFCTADDSCQRGACAPGLPRDCSDGDPLTECVCDEEAQECQCGGTPYQCGTGCETGADCDDGDPCTTDACITFVTPTVCTCTPRAACSCDPIAADGGAADCDDGEADTVDECVPNTDEDIPHAGLCTHEYRPLCAEPCGGLDDDAACADSGTVDGVPAKCTLDLCEPSNAENSDFCCVHVVPLPGAVCGRACTTDAECGDGDPCTPDRCGADGTCDPPEGPMFDCCASDDDCEEDDNLCTTKRCDPTNGQCGFVNNDAVCDDADACTTGDACVDGDCVGQPRDCSDGNDCTQDLCDPVQGCQNPLVEDPPEECVDCRTNPSVCDDANPCTTDTCDPGGRCQHADQNAGVETAVCIRFTCRDQVDCDDGNPCTTDECLNAGTAEPRACLYDEVPGCVVPEALACASPEECDPADCLPDSPDVFCNNVTADCPTSVCDPDTGCRFLPSDACPTIECTPQNAYQTCWDRNPCTLDECLPDFTCVPEGEPRPSALPADSLYRSCVQCETADDCESTGDFDRDDPCVTVECRKPERMHPDDTLGVCHAYVDQERYPDRCEDFDLCTVDACLPGGGCTHTPRVEGCEPCVTDGDCDDQNACTVDTCVLANGATQGYQCEHAAVDDCIPCVGVSDCPAQGGSVCDAWEWVCDTGVCVFEPLATELSEGGLCFAGAGCTTAADCGELAGAVAVCATGTGDCLFLPDAAATGCTDVEDCEFLEPCQRVASCTDGACVLEPIPGCQPQVCATQADCDDGIACTFDLCSSGLCVHEAMECCETAADCPVVGSDACRTATCGPDGYCRATGFGDEVRCGDYCTTDDQCARSCETVVDPDTGAPGPEVCASFCVFEGPCNATNPCTYGTCDIPEGQTQGRCLVCYDWPCSRGVCSAAGRCLWFDGDCRACADDGDCVDHDPCTLDTCEGGTCAHTPDPLCQPIACDETTRCDRGDVCELGLCLSGVCVFVPSPLCD